MYPDFVSAGRCDKCFCVVKYNFLVVWCFFFFFFLPGRRAGSLLKIVFFHMYPKVSGDTSAPVASVCVVIIYKTLLNQG